ncbi:hypothetical protein DF186_14870, partial [Enterococcus hirae]
FNSLALLVRLVQYRVKFLKLIFSFFIFNIFLRFLTVFIFFFRSVVVESKFCGAVSVVFK